MRTILIALFIFAVASPIAAKVHPFVVIWDIGQGQWVTVVTNNVCLHFDMGGEHWLPPVLHFCFNKRNRVYLSHSDMDHIKFLPWGATHLPHLCDAAPPQDPMNSRKKRLIARVRLCRSPIFTNEVKVVEITPPINKTFKGHNDFSRVFVVYGPDRAILIPGDSTSHAEQVWSKRLEQLPAIQILVAGHHGSRTSTGETLLQRLPNLKIAIASARKARYGHPHPEVVARLLAHGVPCLRTEIFGNIGLEL